ncbi:hypothetical protein RSOLAG22IIIB_11595 [Rhizoctonia solani]|uniref:DNA-directed RNA polymerase III subunit RPC3 n=1 Tax=Rhizoctonia solani TaxID=456999 RepID=A0A0K6GA23_9AGAM|nr:hypothetical protein RSOLAG22IIIB_11595 [Rhizoctonia solani]
MTQPDEIRSDNPTPWGAASTFLSSSGGSEGGGLPLNSKLKRGVVGAARDKRGGPCVHSSNFGRKWELHEYKIAKVAMLVPDDVRMPINIFSTANILALQTVPKSADGQPARTVYLWYIDSARANATVLTLLHATLANVVERLDREKEQARSILDKLDISEIDEDESRFNPSERENLKGWETKRG